MKSHLFFSGLALVLAAQVTVASPEYLRQVPNGNRHRCATCHEQGERLNLNAFGTAFFGANCQWTPALAAEDADADGVSNGRELGDPEGAWKPGVALPLVSYRVSLPGDPGSKPVPLSRLAIALAPFSTLLGHFHPLFVHLPIGGLVLVGLFEILALAPRFRPLTQSRRLVLGFTLLGALMAGLCGWVLSQSGRYETDLLRWHHWTGLAVAAACLITLLLSFWPERWGYQLSLWSTILLLAVASHFGGSLTHGRDFLTLQLPASCPLTNDPAYASRLQDDSRQSASATPKPGQEILQAE